MAIRGFCRTYNEVNGTNFERAECLDVSNRTSPQPEVLLVCRGEADMVVERTSVLWPKAYLREHKHFHQLGDGLAVRLGGRFQDAPHAVCIDEAELSGVVDVRRACATICEAIEHDQISGGDPFPWRLVAAGDLGDSETEVKGLGVVTLAAAGLYSGGPQGIRARRKAALEGFRTTCDDALKHAAEKFRDYPEVSRVALLQFIGDATYVLDDDLKNIVAACADAQGYDEIWVAVHEWLDGGDYRVGWRRTWSRRGRGPT